MLLEIVGGAVVFWKSVISYYTVILATSPLFILVLVKLDFSAELLSTGTDNISLQLQKV